MPETQRRIRINRQSWHYRLVARTCYGGSRQRLEANITSPVHYWGTVTIASLSWLLCDSAVIAAGVVFCALCVFYLAVMASAVLRFLPAIGGFFSTLHAAHFSPLAQGTLFVLAGVALVFGLIFAVGAIGNRISRFWPRLMFSE